MGLFPIYRLFFYQLLPRCRSSLSNPTAMDYLRALFLRPWARVPPAKGTTLPSQRRNLTIIDEQPLIREQQQTSSDRSDAAINSSMAQTGVRMKIAPVTDSTPAAVSQRSPSLDEIRPIISAPAVPGTAHLNSTLHPLTSGNTVLNRNGIRRHVSTRSSVHSFLPSRTRTSDCRLPMRRPSYEHDASTKNTTATIFIPECKEVEKNGNGDTNEMARLQIQECIDNSRHPTGKALDLMPPQLLSRHEQPKSPYRFGPAKPVMKFIRVRRKHRCLKPAR